MALNSYTALKAAVADWLERGDLAARTPDFIALAESRLNRRLTARGMEAEAALTAPAGARTLALPAGFREPVALWRVDGAGRTRLRYAPPALLVVAGGAGAPGAWMVDGGEIAFERACDRTYAFALRMRVRLALSDAAPVNPVLTDYPDLYLFGALTEAAPYLRDGDLAALFDARFERALAEANAKESRAAGLATLSTEGPLAAEAGFDLARG